MGEQVLINHLEIYQSLNNAARQARGTEFSVLELKEMTVTNLLSILAPNNVRFTHVPKGKTAGTEKKDTITLTRKEATAIVLFLEAYSEEMGDFDDECRDLDVSLECVYKELCEFVREKGKR